MFGFFRLIAALLVLATHIGGVPFVAGAAVWGFFMLSGLLMAGALNNRYGLDAGGIFLFLGSRGLRLYPMYWIGLLMTSLLLWMGNDAERALFVNAALKFPGTTEEWAANLLILGQTTFGIGRTDASLSPSSWAVDVEILMYFCSCLFLARSERVAVAALAILCTIFPVLWWIARAMVHAGEVSLASQLLYSFLPAALLPYTIGTVMWFKRERLKSMGAGWLVTGVAGVLICTVFVHPRAVTLAYILVLPCLIAIIGALMYWPMNGWLRRIDTFAGHMSYPIYLLQWACAYLFVLVVPPDWGWIAIAENHYVYSHAAFLCVITLAILVSIASAWLIEEPLEKKRHALLRAYNQGTENLIR